MLFWFFLAGKSWFFMLFDDLPFDAIDALCWFLMLLSGFYDAIRAYHAIGLRQEKQDKNQTKANQKHHLMTRQYK